MEQIIYLEVLGRAETVLARHRLAQFPVSVGRDYSNDVILDDEYISPRHLLIEQDEQGALSIADRGSENGLFLLAPLKKITRAEIKVDIPFRIGHTLLRIRRPDQVIAATALDKISPGALHGMINSAWLFVAAMLFLAVFLFAQEYWHTFTQPKLGRIFVSILPLLLLTPVWAGFWALVSRLFSHQLAYFAHAVVFCIAIIALYIWEALGEYYSFAFSAQLSADILVNAGYTLIFAVLLYAHLRMSTLLKPKRVSMVAAFIAISFIGLGLFTDYVKNAEFSDTLDYHSELKPVAFKWAKSKTLDGFIADTGKLQKKLEKSVRED